MLFRATKTMYWVAKTLIQPNGDWKWCYMRGAVFSTSGDLYNKQTFDGKPPTYEPAACLDLISGKTWMTHSTFRAGNPQFLNCVWGPYDETQVKDLWLFSGAVGPEARDVSLFRVGSQQTAYLDDFERRQLVCEANFGAIMGTHLLKRSAEGVFSIAPTFDLSTIIQEEKAA